MSDQGDPIHKLKPVATDAVQIVVDALRGLKFGTVKLIVQDGVLIRVERTENRQVARRLVSS